MHGHLNEEPILGVLLKLQSIQQCLSLLQEGKRALILLMRDEMDSRIVKLMQDYWYFVLIEV